MRRPARTGLVIQTVLLALFSFDSLSAAPAAGGNGGGDFPFIHCQSGEIELREFTVSRDAASDTGYSAWYRTTFGRRVRLTAGVEQQGSSWVIFGSSDRETQFRAEVPLDCQGHCLGHADLRHGPLGVPVFGRMPPLVPARCSVGPSRHLWWRLR